MIPYSKIDPAIFRVGPLEVRWYGLMYVLSFLAIFSLVKYQIKKFNLKQIEPHLDNLNLVLIISVILGGRLGYVLFYNFSYYVHHPLEILATWLGGMSFHGGLLGVILGGFLFCRSKKIDFWRAADLYTVPLPIGLGLGRIGNFINGELYGRTTDVPWGMIFPGGGPVPRHPSQIYEALLEGLVLFVILWSLKNKRLAGGSMLAIFLFLYGVFRIIVEQFRQPDAQIGFLFGSFTMGQLLSSFMILGGIALFIFRQKKSPQPAAT
jgi:phosphatidylglycerol:prolipoprotein diacylglycerol transferase